MTIPHSINSFLSYGALHLDGFVYSHVYKSCGALHLAAVHRLTVTHRPTNQLIKPDNS